MESSGRILKGEELTEIAFVDNLELGIFRAPNSP